jgi:hypothetical protein
MKKSIKLIQLIILLLFYSQSFAQTPPITDGLVGYWPFNGYANDESGNENHGLGFGGVQLTSDRFGNPNSAYQYDGIDDYIEIVNKNLFENFNQGTISCWVKVDTEGYAPIINSTSLDVVDLLVLSLDNRRTYFQYYKVSPNNAVLASDAIDQNWHLLTVTSDGASWSMYIDMVKQSNIEWLGQNAGNWFSSLTSSESVLRFGRQQWAQENIYFKGVIDDIMIFNRPLSEVEIQKIYSSIPIVEENCTWSCDGINLIYNIGNVGIGTSTPDEKTNCKRENPYRRGNH